MYKNSDQARTNDAYWCVVSGSDLWLINKTLPRGEASQFNLPEDKAIQIGEYHNIPVMWVNDEDCADAFELTSLRTLLAQPEPLFLLASKAVQLGYMTRNQRFCSQCGTRTYLHHKEMAMQCQECRTLHYPRIFPCIIVAVRKENQLLLAQHNRHKGGLYTVLAGFVEVGETLEQCVAREVFEETGIQVTNIAYFGSQPWAFPSSMMMAFTADYQAGEITIDPNELCDARWFDGQQLPELAPPGTIARDLIDHCLTGSKR
ncbi:MULTISPECIES: NAD(+) diphosphatase [unclassified Vibrio]|uniref:NAD-capped RNA hydrolase NudC n=1 Tax=Vibrio sp. HB236076 TaxID=3232307 RepID=A0AB39HFS9_9VIBR|nr:NAD(+) diphosphatase [Vibrio sp. HB161653]MDP5255468.1 NAD(+) diphosphatase [Vibrio sp. HB161653]